MGLGYYRLCWSTQRQGQFICSNRREGCMGHRYKEVDRCCSEKFFFEREREEKRERKRRKREKVRELRGHGKYYGHQQSL